MNIKKKQEIALKKRVDNKKLTSLDYYHLSKLKEQCIYIIKNRNKATDILLEIIGDNKDE